MKHTLLIKVALCAAIMFISTGANALGKDFKKLAKIEGVEHVHIGKFLLNLAAKNGESVNIGEDITFTGKSGDMLKKLENISIYNCEEEDGVEAMSKQVASILNGRGWEPLVVGTDEDGEKMKISQFKKGKKSTIAIFHEEEGESALIVLEGKMDFKKMIEKQVEISVNEK